MYIRVIVFDKPLSVNVTYQLLITPNQYFHHHQILGSGIYQVFGTAAIWEEKRNGCCRDSI